MNPGLLSGVFCCNQIGLLAPTLLGLLTLVTSRFVFLNYVYDGIILSLLTVYERRQYEKMDHLQYCVNCRFSHVIYLIRYSNVFRKDTPVCY